MNYFASLIGFIMVGILFHILFIDHDLPPSGQDDEFCHDHNTILPCEYCEDIWSRSDV